MRLTIAYYKTTKRNLVLINNATYQRETLSERPIRQPLSVSLKHLMTCSYAQKGTQRKEIRRRAASNHDSDWSVYKTT